MATQITTGQIKDAAITQPKLAAEVDPIGVQDLYVPAVAMTPRVTSPCAPPFTVEIAGNNLNVQSLDFDQTTQEYAQFQVILPRKYNLGTFTYQAKWSSAIGSGAVTWGLQAVALADGDALSTAFGSSVEVNDAVGSADTVRLSTTSSAVTIGNTPSDSDSIYFQVYRNPSDGSDNLAGDARLEGIHLHITVDAAKDA